jgi:hypothetical protein
MRTAKELEQLISDSALFSIDRAKDGERFANEEMRFIKNLMEHLLITRKEDIKDINEWSVEVMETAKACVKAYKVERGIPFLHYFNAALKKKLFIARAKERENERRGGLSIDEEKKRLIRHILKYCDKRGDDINDPDVQEKIADKFGVSLEIVREAVEINYDATVQSGDAIKSNEDGDGGRLFDRIATDVELADKRIEKIESIRKIVISIDTAFREQQERTKPLLAKLLTAYLIKTLEDVCLIKMAGGLESEFWDAEIYTGYQAYGEIPTAREISETFGKHEAHASRTFNNFLEKIKQKR